jgi:hypothetical protein
MLKRLGWVVIVGMMSGSALGHHALEYIEMESYSTTRRGERVLHLHYDYMVDDRDNPDLDHWEFTPGISYGITDRLMLDLHTHFASFGIDHIVDDERDQFEPGGPSPFMEAAAGTLQYRLVEGWLIDIAVAATLEVPFSRAETLLGSTDNVYCGMLIIGREFGDHGNLTLNLAYEEEGEEDDTTWALGIKAPLSDDPHGIAGGVEFLGSFDDTGDNWAILPGVYIPVGGSRVMLKSGLEFGKADGADTRRANVTLMTTF